MSAAPTPLQLAPRTRKRRATLALLGVGTCLLLLMVYLAWPAWGVRQATAALRDHDPAGARAWLDSAEAWGGRTAGTQLLRVRIARIQGRFSEVREALEQAARAGAAPLAVEREQWLSAAAAGQLDAALPHLSDLLVGETTEIGDVCEAFIAGYLLNHRHAEGLRLVENWMSDFPEAAYPRVVRARILVAAHRVQEAELELVKARELAPHDPHVLIELADSWLGARRYDDALPLFEACRNSRPLMSRAILGSAICRNSLGQPREALLDLQRRLPSDPENAQLRVHLGQFLLDAGRPKETLAVLEPHLKEHPDHLDCRYLRALALAASGRRDEADEEFLQVSTAREVLTEVGQLQDEAGQFPDRIEPRLKISRRLIAGKQYDIALTWLQSVLVLDSQSREAHELLVTCYDQLAKKHPEYAARAASHRQFLGQSR